MVLDIDLPRIVADYPNIEIQAVLAAENRRAADFPKIPAR